MSSKQVFLAGAVAAVLLCASQTQAQDYAFQGFATADAMNQMHAAMRDNMMESSSQARAVARRGGRKRGGAGASDEGADHLSFLAGRLDARACAVRGIYRADFRARSR